MDNLASKLGYLRGLAEGLDINDDTKEGKVIRQIILLLEEIGRSLEELNAQWYDDNYWHNIHNQVYEIDRLTEEFNERAGVLASM